MAAGTSITRVLVSAEERTGALAAVRGLRLGGYEPWVVATTGRPLAAASRVVGGVVPAPHPGESPDEFASAVAAAARDAGAALVLPGSEDALLALAPRSEHFRGVPPADVVERVLDKAVVNEEAAAAGLETPPTTVVSLDELRDGRALEYPVVLKPARTKARGSTGTLVRVPVQIVSAPAELAPALASLSTDMVLLQPFLLGRLAAVSGVLHEGRIVVSAHQVAERIWPPRSGISAHASTVARDEALERRLEQLLGQLGWSGIFQAQFLQVAERSYFLDLNPRIYGSLALAVGAGANLPAVWADVLLGRPARPTSYRVGVHYRAESNDLHAIVALVRAGDWAAAARGLRPRRRTVHAVFSRRDPAPAARRLWAVVRGS